MNILNRVRNSTILKNMGWNSLGVSVYFGCQLLTTIIVSRMAGYEVAGYFALGSSLTAIPHTIAMYNIRAFQVSDSKGQYSNGVYISTRIFTCIAALVACAVFVFINDYSPVQRQVVVMYMIYRLSEAVSDVLHGVDQKHDRMDIIGKSFILRGVALSVSFVLALWKSSLFYAVLAMSVMVYLVILLYDVPNSRKLDDLKLVFSFRQTFSLLKVCFPLLIVKIIFGFLPVFPRNTLERMFGSEALGIYASVNTPAFLINVMAGFILSPLINSFIESLNKKDKSAFYRLFLICTGFILAVSLAVIVIINIWGEFGLELLYGKSILPYSYLLYFTIWNAALTTYVSFLSVVQIVIRDVKGLFISNLAAFLFCLLTSSFFIRNYYMSGANYVLFFSQAILGILSFVSCFAKIHRVMQSSAGETGEQTKSKKANKWTNKKTKKII